MPIVPSETTLAAAMTRTQRSVTLASGTGVSAGMFLAIGGEIVLVQSAISATIFEVERGQQGTAARPHLSGAIVYLSSTTSPPAYTFATKNNRVIVRNDVTNNLPDFPLPVGSRVVDPDSGYEYLVVDTSEAMTVGEWVAISRLGQATPLTVTSVGRVGIITQAIGASDTLALALVVGQYAGAQGSSILSSDPAPNWLAPSSVTSGAVKVVLPGTSALTSGVMPQANVVWGAIYVAETTSGVSSGTIPGLTVILNNPYVQGAAIFST